MSRKMPTGFWYSDATLAVFREVIAGKLTVKDAQKKLKSGSNTPWWVSAFRHKQGYYAAKVMAARRRRRKVAA
jgi:hypothetical protein